jgi:diguanylate cyclase (GGDEF)-like protein
MVQEEKLSAVLSEFARTLATDFPIQGILDHLVGRIVEILPITASGVTLISAGKAPRYIAASNGAALRYERLQTSVRQGPCLAAFATGHSIAVPDLKNDLRFPDFGPLAVTAGLAAVFTFPLRHGDVCLGALDLYRDSTGSLTEHQMSAAQTLADVATAYLLNAQARDDARATADRFRHSAVHDPLTGLPNRSLLEQRLEHATQRARRSNTNAAILFADLDRFKLVNDTYGHQIGDELLVAVASRLTSLIRPGDTLARVSGDEFVFLCEDLKSPDDVEVLANRIDESFMEPFKLSAVEVRITASVGMAYAGPGEEIADGLMDLADTAMYQAKRKGGAGHQIIDLREALKEDERISLDSDLRTALTEERLELAYQPIVRSTDGLITGVEALLRWNHPSRGLIPTMLAIGIAEQSSLICEIGAWVLDTACHDRTQWTRDHPETPLDLAVNISTRQLMDPKLFGITEHALTASAMAPDALILEMTENIFIEDSDRATSVLAELSELGIRLALDDFGTGYSSLSYLRRLPVDMVKIDQGFVADIGNARKGGPVVAAIAHLAHVLDLTVTAEGVETERQRAEICSIGCESSQGYFYARPMTAAKIDSLLGSSSGPVHLPTARLAAANAT